MSSLPKHGMLPETHYVPDVLAPNLRVVFCGTALGYHSAATRAYYAHPGNFFWRTLHATGLTSELVAPTDYLRALDHGIGLTDLCKLHFGNDVDLPTEAFDRESLTAKVRKFRPRFLAFTSKTAASVYLEKPTGKFHLGLQPDVIGNTRIFVLPSPSGQARKFWQQDIWQQLADLARA